MTFAIIASILSPQQYRGQQMLLRLTYSLVVKVYLTFFVGAIAVINILWAVMPKS